ncbi:MAG: hypothetical protein QF515_07400 [Pseudomonadales bacterium]|jgi:hypothetical protein|nr:hypothetical protein [Pseudomonadales bacterium]MDP6470023.1 hypothetical protein [Pseudomonadales bacterium]MDP6826923.1 hypothetical protein [Pseudomonadales bacterium]|tara:strand:- start:2068 stop:2970 length:903 start_codon:yes stop_codon:yes gene_type:complete
MNLAEQDDAFHPATSDQRWWSETYWFSFDDPQRGLSGTFYPLLRPNLDIAALTVAVWAPGLDTAWTAPYYRSLWHLELPVFTDAGMQLEGLRYEVLEPLQRYRVCYEDAGVFQADLRVSGIAENHVIVATPEVGHWDQPTRVQGTLDFADRSIDIDCFGMRDRSWGPRLDDNSARASYVYGIRGDASFLVVTQMGGEAHSSGGYLERDGVRSRLLDARVEVERDALQRIARARIVATDEHGRELDTRGEPRNHIAKQASPGYFAWMSMVRWDFCGGAVGQFQDVWSPDRLSAMAGGHLDL